MGKLRQRHDAPGEHNQHVDGVREIHSIEDAIAVLSGQTDTPARALLIEDLRILAAQMRAGRPRHRCTQAS